MSVTDGGQLKEKVRVADPAPGAVRFAGEVQVRADATLVRRPPAARSE